MRAFKTMMKTELKLSLRGMDMFIFAICAPLVVLVLLVILLVLWAKVFRRNRRYGSRSGRRYRSSSYRGGRRGR